MFKIKSCKTINLSWKKKLRRGSEIMNEHLSFSRYKFIYEMYPSLMDSR